jgi:hypothetical protein
MLTSFGDWFLQILLAWALTPLSWHGSLRQRYASISSYPQGLSAAMGGDRAGLEDEQGSDMHVLWSGLAWGT